MPGIPPLTDRARAVLRIVVEACEVRSITPRLSDIAYQLRALGFQADDYAVRLDVRRLVAGRKLIVNGSGIGRTYLLPRTACATVPRPTYRPARRVGSSSCIAAAQAANTGWPRPTAASIAAYDARMRRLPYARHNWTPGVSIPDDERNAA